MKRTTILILAALVFAGTGCHFLGIRGNGHVTTDQRQVGEFSEIQADGMFDIVWSSGPPSLTITTDENLLSYVQSEIHDKRLRLHVRQRVLPTHGLKVAVSSPTRTGSRLTGASDLTAHALTGDSYAVETTGAADITLDGSVDHLLADMTGASDLKAKSLQTRTAEISTTGAASAEVTVSENLKVTITGAGEVVYHGNPVVTKHVTGAGEVRRKD
jgi:Putative auto-transporter adhesin, head GIN domain